MRYAADHKEKTKARILESAAAAFRREGYHATGVDKVMEAAGLTPGGFYAHFPSKDALLAESLEHCVATSGGPLDAGIGETGEVDRAGAIVDHYLTESHRAHPECGCPLPSLAPEVSRAGSKPRKAFERLVSDLIAKLASGSPPDQADDRSIAIAIAALCVGGMTLARAVHDPEFSDRILAACRAFAHGGLRRPLPKKGKTTAGRPRAKPRAKRH